MAATVL